MSSTIDPQDVSNFESQAHLWWDEVGPFKPLHKINPHRISFIKSEIMSHFLLDEDKLSKPLSSLKILDIGCGGGLVCEPLCRLGGTVTGIDAGAENIRVASAHAEQHDLTISYIHTTAEDHLKSNKIYDVVIALEIIEHVSDVPLFLKSCVELLKPGGVLIMSTLNRTVKSYLLGIVAAEYILRWVPQGTHNWRQFIEPAELVFHLEDLGVKTKSLKGIEFNPFTRKWFLSDGIDVNYLLSATKQK